MNPRTRLLLRLACLSIATVPAWGGAVCNFKAPNLLWNYEGTVGADRRIRMTLAIDGGLVSGVYFYADEFKDIRLTGTVVDGKRISLEALDSAGRIVGGFEGAFLENGPKYPKRFLTCDFIVGQWRGAASRELRSFEVFRTDNADGTLEHRYALAGAKDDEVVNQNALRFWRAMMSDDRKTVATLVAYPVKARIPGSTEFKNALQSKSPDDAFSTLSTPEEFLAVYDKVFSPRYRAGLALSLPRNMGANAHGIFLEVASGAEGAGAFLMFNAEGKVVAFFNI
jgi:hypothetical protein